MMHAHDIYYGSLHSPDGLTEWNWNSKLSLMHWLYNSSQKYCKTSLFYSAFLKS